MSHPPKTAIIFDLDGTLLDTLHDLGESMNAVLEREGFPVHPVDAYRSFVGDGVTNLVRRALPPSWHERAHREPGYLERCVRDMRQEYGKRWSLKTTPYPGVPELLRDLGSRRIRMAVLTNKPHELAVTIVDHFLGRHTFLAVLGAREGLPHKPDPAGALELLTALDTPAAATLYVGDSSTDMDTARAAGLTSVGVLWGFRTRVELLEHGAHHLVERPRELVRYVAEA